MSKRTTFSKNILKAITENLVSVVAVYINHPDMEETLDIEPEKFISDLQHYNSSGIFAETVDFKYEITGKESLIVSCNNLCPAYYACDLYVHLKLTENSNIEDVKNLLDKTIFTDKKENTEMKEAKQTLIRPYAVDFKSEEVVHKDFVTRQEFINRTGIFVTPNYFSMMYEDFVEANVPADEFIENYEKKYATCVQKVPLSGTFKYEIDDDDVSGLGIFDDVDLSIWEIVDSLALEIFHKWLKLEELTEETKKIIEDQMAFIERQQALLTGQVEDYPCDTSMLS